MRMGNNDSIDCPQPESREPLERGVVEEFASVNEDIGGARRRDVTQEDGGVAPPVPVPWLSCLGANGASLRGVGEAADTRDALAGACAKEDEFRLTRFLIICRRGRDRAAGGGEGARGVEVR